jgi:uncharacterized protein (TIGR02284 family)
MEKEKTIKLLNILITINNDRIEGYETAAKETQEQDLKNLFGQLAATSQKCKQELITEVKKLGGEITSGSITSSEFLSVWLNLVKAALLRDNRKAILKSCEYGESITIDTYFKALRNNMTDITAEQQIMINAQHNLIKEDYSNIKYMRDALAYNQIKYDIPLTKSTKKYSWF